MSELTIRNPALTLANGTYPSVTRVLDLVPKPFLIAWSAKIQRDGAVLMNGTTTHNYRDIQDQSRNIGIMTHALISAYIHGVEPDPLPEGDLLTAARRSFKLWLMDFAHGMDGGPITNDNVVAVEEGIESGTLGLNGRPDLIIRGKKGLEILDWKTSPNLYPETRMEMAAYALLAAEKYREPVVKLTAVRLDYNMNATFTPEKDLLEIEDYDEDAALFQLLLKAFRPLQAWQSKHHS